MNIPRIEEEIQVHTSRIVREQADNFGSLDEYILTSSSDVHSLNDIVRSRPKWIVEMAAFKEGT